MRLRIALLCMGALALVSTQSSAQTSCTLTNQAGLLAQFSDNASPGSIAPVSVRNVICSALLQEGTGGGAVAQAPSTSPFTFQALVVGELLVSSGAVSISRNNGATFYPVSVMGGVIPVLANDQVRITWYSTTIPTVTFLPSGPSQ